MRTIAVLIAMLAAGCGHYASPAQFAQCEHAINVAASHGVNLTSGGSTRAIRRECVNLSPHQTRVASRLAAMDVDAYIQAHQPEPN